MPGRIYVIDGLDGSGKSTQTQRIYEALQRQGEKALLISYPDYADESSALVRMYLNGEFSENADDVNAYAASSFYAVDRYAGYMRRWKRQYDEGYLIIATRYVSSNAIHQMSKLPEEEWGGFLNWLADYEYNKLGLPKPNRVIFLDMPRRVAESLLETRYKGDEGRRDIHEKNRNYLERCQQTAAYAATAENWDVISCAEGDKPLAIEEITRKIFEVIKEDLKKE